MIEEAHQVPVFIKMSTTFKMLTISWVLVSMLLSSFYRSILVVELNSHLKGHMPSSLDETFCPIEGDLLDIEANSEHSLALFWDSTRFRGIINESDTLILEQQHT